MITELSHGATATVTIVARFIARCVCDRRGRERKSDLLAVSFSLSLFLSPPQGRADVSPLSRDSQSLTEPLRDTFIHSLFQLPRSLLLAILMVSLSSLSEVEVLKGSERSRPRSVF